MNLEELKATERAAYTAVQEKQAEYYLALNAWSPLSEQVREMEMMEKVRRQIEQERATGPTLEAC